MIYKKDGKWGKLKGFDYYLRSENKLRPNQRKDFLIKSEGYIGMINELSSKEYPYMDEKMSDNELLQIWNDIWDEWGWVMDEFKDKWIREKLNTKNTTNGNSSNDWWEI